MTTQQVLEKLPKLSGSAAKVLIYRALSGDGAATNRELMRAVGIGNERTIIKAKRQLRDSGLLGTGSYAQPLSASALAESASGVSISASAPAQSASTPLLESASGLALSASPRIRAQMDATVVHAEASLRQRAMDADLMEVGGDWQNRTSPTSLRRAAQIEALQAAWEEHFQQHLSIGQAKRLLQLAGDSAEVVYDQVEIVAGMPKKVNFPFRYIEAILARPQAQRVVPVAEPQVRPAVIGKPDEPQDYMMSEPSERSKMIQARLRAAGLLGREDDD